VLLNQFQLEKVTGLNQRIKLPQLKLQRQI